MKFVNERTMFKTLVDRKGAIFSITTKKTAYFFFLTGKFVGAKIAPTTDPDLGIVELCNYDIDRILENWDRLHSVRVTRRR